MNKEFRKAIIAGNWKMNKTPAEAVELIEAIKAELAGKDTSGCGIIACVPYVDIDAAVKAAANETIYYTEDPIVSSDVIGQTCGTLFDAQCTKIMEVDGKQLVKIITWYDNEMSYTAQMVRTAKYLINK